MMHQKYKAAVIRCGLLAGGSRTLTGWSAGPALVIPGQGWAELTLLKPEHLAAAIIKTAAGPIAEDGAEEGEKSEGRESYGLASCSTPIALGDYLELTRNASFRLHIPASILAVARMRSGMSLEERALLMDGTLTVKDNNMQALTGTDAMDISEFSTGKAPGWLANLQSSQ